MKTAHDSNTGNGMSRKKTTLIVLILVLLVGLITGLVVVNQTQAPQKQASGPSCPLNGFICRWEREPGVSYSYKITDEIAKTVVKEGIIPASEGKETITVTYTPEVNKSYSCEVTATNDCGSATDKANAFCTTTEQSPTPTPTTTLTPTATPSGTLTPTLTPSATPTGTLTPTLTPTNTPTSTPTSTPNPSATVTPNPSATNTPIPLASNTPTNLPGQPTATPAPTLPIAGVPQTLIFTMITIGGLAIIAVGLLLPY